MPGRPAATSPASRTRAATPHKASRSVPRADRRVSASSTSSDLPASARASARRIAIEVAGRMRATLRVARVPSIPLVVCDDARVRVTVLAGGIGGSRFLLGLRALGHDITVIGNTGDDIRLFGLRVCPDLDTVMYTLGGCNSAERGGGREDESFRVRDELATYGAEPSGVGLGDLDVATHLLRAQWLAEGLTLSDVTARLCERWRPGVRLLPATDDPVETHVTLVDGRTVHFQEWWVRLRAEVAATDIVLAGAPAAEPAPEVFEAILDADAVVLP